MNKNLNDLQNSIEQLMPTYRDIGKVLNMVEQAGVTGSVTKQQFSHGMAETLEFCSFLITDARNKSDEARYYAFVEYQKVLESGAFLLQEINEKFSNCGNLSGILNNVGESIATCGATIDVSYKKIATANIENEINDLVDKILLVETEYNAGNLSIEKANKHVQKIKNTFKSYGITQTGNKDIDDQIEFLNYAIEESEKMYATETLVETSDKCVVTEFLDEQTEQKIEDITFDIQGLTNCLQQLNAELPHQFDSYGVDLDWVFNQIRTINELASDSSNSYDDIHSYVISLDKNIGMLREQIINTSISFNDCSKTAQTACSLAQNLQEKVNKSTKEIVASENAKRVEKISTQLDVLEDVSEVRDVEYHNKVGKLLVAQSNKCLETNPELQGLIIANQQKANTIQQNITKTV